MRSVLFNFLTLLALSLTGIPVSEAYTSRTVPVPLHGDVNASGTVDLTDAIVILNYLYLGQPLPAGSQDATDINRDGNLNITDPVNLLSYLFTGGQQTFNGYSIGRTVPLGPDDLPADLAAADIAVLRDDELEYVELENGDYLDYETGLADASGLFADSLTVYLVDGSDPSRKIAVLTADYSDITTGGASTGPASAGELALEEIFTAYRDAAQPFDLPAIYLAYANGINTGSQIDAALRQSVMAKLNQLVSQQRLLDYTEFLNDGPGGAEAVDSVVNNFQFFLDGLGGSFAPEDDLQLTLKRLDPARHPRFGALVNVLRGLTCTGEPCEPDTIAGFTVSNDRDPYLFDFQIQRRSQTVFPESMSIDIDDRNLLSDVQDSAEAMIANLNSLIFTNGRALIVHDESPFDPFYLAGPDETLLTALADELSESAAGPEGQGAGDGGGAQATSVAPFHMPTSEKYLHFQIWDPRQPSKYVYEDLVYLIDFLKSIHYEFRDHIGFIDKPTFIKFVHEYNNTDGGITSWLGHSGRSVNGYEYVDAAYHSNQDANDSYYAALEKMGFSHMIKGAIPKKGVKEIFAETDISFYKILVHKDDLAAHLTGKKQLVASVLCHGNDIISMLNAEHTIGFDTNSDSIYGTWGMQALIEGMTGADGTGTLPLKPAFEYMTTKRIKQAKPVKSSSNGIDYIITPVVLYDFQDSNLKDRYDANGNRFEATFNYDSSLEGIGPPILKPENPARDLVLYPYVWKVEWYEDTAFTVEFSVDIDILDFADAQPVKIISSNTDWAIVPYGDADNDGDIDTPRKLAGNKLWFAIHWEDEDAHHCGDAARDWEVSLDAEYFRSIDNPKFYLHGRKEPSHIWTKEKLFQMSAAFADVKDGKRGFRPFYKKGEKIAEDDVFHVWEVDCSDARGYGAASNHASDNPFAGN